MQKKGNTNKRVLCPYCLREFLDTEKGIGRLRKHINTHSGFHRIRPQVGSDLYLKEQEIVSNVKRIYEGE